jgi:hypothetical protein
MKKRHKKVRVSSDTSYSRSPFLEGAISAFDLFGISSTFKDYAFPFNKPESQKQSILRNFAEASKYLNESFQLFESQCRK